ncbi:ATP-binding protein [Streptomyces flaveolus]|uniref:ATP-binding protein n=1 Tax=Streptomyces flaveolus TaxID=67297 RepID=UPI0033D27479
MRRAAQNQDQGPRADRRITASAAFEGSAEIARARSMARDFLTSVQAVHGLPVSARAMGTVQLVVSELVTNARKYAPGPCLLDLEVSGDAVEVSVWDSSPTLPSVSSTDPDRIGQHGLEIVMAASQTFCVHQEPMGKRITATVQLTDEVPPTRPAKTDPPS